MTERLYVIHLWCSTCDKSTTTIAPMIPPPKPACHWCLRYFNKVREMKILTAEQLGNRP